MVRANFTAHLLHAEEVTTAFSHLTLDRDQGGALTQADQGRRKMSLNLFSSPSTLDGHNLYHGWKLTLKCFHIKQSFLSLSCYI